VRSNPQAPFSSCVPHKKSWVLPMPVDTLIAPLAPSLVAPAPAASRPRQYGTSRRRFVGTPASFLLACAFGGSWLRS
jgi:hypothetical protein